VRPHLELRRVDQWKWQHEVAVSLVDVTALKRPVRSDDVAREIADEAVDGRPDAAVAVAPDREHAARAQHARGFLAKLRPVEPVRGLRRREEIRRARFHADRLRRFLPVLDAGMHLRLAQLSCGRLGRNHAVEVRRECDRGLAVAGRDVDRKLSCRRLRGEPFEERGRIVGTILLVPVRLPGEVVLENGRG
jgi:hypothetical protein